MPGLTRPKSTAASLVQDQDIEIVDADKSDLTITIIGAAEKDGTKHITDVLVSKNICISSSYLQSAIDASDEPSEIVLGGSLKRGTGSKHDKNEGENLEGLLVVLAHLHGLTESRMQDLGLYSVSILGLWSALAYLEYDQATSHDQARSVKSALKSWFEKWYATTMEHVELDINSAYSLAFPCQFFDHAQGFARVTMWLAYNHVGHMKERPPKGSTGFRGLHLPPGEFVGPVNHARSGLKTTLHKSLYKQCGYLLRNGTNDCQCWDSTAGQYLASLTRINVFPVEDFISHSSITQICQRLKDFKHTYKPACHRCKTLDWLYIVRQAKSNTEGYFQGLCLDCMNRSRPKGGNPDADYWNLNSRVGDRWDTKCRLKHDQSTWYVSWLGRPEVREKLMRGPDGYKEN